MTWYYLENSSSVTEERKDFCEAVNLFFCVFPSFYSTLGGEINAQPWQDSLLSEECHWNLHTKQVVYLLSVSYKPIPTSGVECPSKKVAIDFLFLFWLLWLTIPLYYSLISFGFGWTVKIIYGQFG